MNSIAIICITIVVLALIFWIMPTKKMKAVSKELKSLLQILPISKAIESLTKEKNENAP